MSSHCTKSVSTKVALKMHGAAGSIILISHTSISGEHFDQLAVYTIIVDLNQSIQFIISVLHGGIALGSDDGFAFRAEVVRPDQVRPLVIGVDLFVPPALAEGFAALQGLQGFRQSGAVQRFRKRFSAVERINRLRQQEVFLDGAGAAVAIRLLQAGVLGSRGVGIDQILLGGVDGNGRAAAVGADQGAAVRVQIAGDHGPGSIVFHNVIDDLGIAAGRPGQRPVRGEILRRQQHPAAVHDIIVGGADVGGGAVGVAQDGIAAGNVGGGAVGGIALLREEKALAVGILGPGVLDPGISGIRGDGFAAEAEIGSGQGIVLLIPGVLRPVIALGVQRRLTVRRMRSLRDQVPCLVPFAVGLGHRRQMQRSRGRLVRRRRPAGRLAQRRSA